MPRKPLRLQIDCDRLGEIRAEIADLQEEADSIKQRLIDSGKEDIDGELFHVKVSHYDIERVNYRGLVEHLKPKPSVIKKYTTIADQVRVSVNARGDA